MEEEKNIEEQRQSPQQEEAKENADEKSVPYARFSEINKKYRELEARLRGYEEKQKQEEEKALAEQNRWKELYEKLQAELNDERQKSLRLKIASSKGLPQELIERLRGETEEEIEKDADALLEIFNKRNEPRAAGFPPAPKGGNNAVVDIASETDPKKIRETWRKLKRQ